MRPALYQSVTNPRSLSGICSGQSGKIACGLPVLRFALPICILQNVSFLLSASGTKDLTRPTHEGTASSHYKVYFPVKDTKRTNQLWTRKLFAWWYWPCFTLCNIVTWLSGTTEVVLDWILDLLTTYSQLVATSNYSVINTLHTLHFTVLHTLSIFQPAVSSLVVAW
jgi:hypothetical protein